MHILKLTNFFIVYFLGAKPLGPKGPRALFYMLPKQYRVQGLCTALSFKYAQNNLHIVDSLEIPTDDPEVLIDFMMFNYLKYMYKIDFFLFFCSIHNEKKKSIIEFN